MGDGWGGRGVWGFRVKGVGFRFSKKPAGVERSASILGERLLRNTTDAGGRTRCNCLAARPLHDKEAIQRDPKP